MIRELFDKETHVNYAKILIVGIIIQGLYQYINTGDLKVKYFLLYICSSFFTSLLYYKIFSE